MIYVKLSTGEDLEMLKKVLAASRGAASIRALPARRVEALGEMLGDADGLAEAPVGRLMEALVI
jgi:hypothetical protein